MEPKKSVLAFFVKEGKVCLGMKKRGHGKGRWNGFGGKVEPGESDEEAVVREVREEAGVIIKPEDLIFKADFYYHEPPQDWTVKVFVCNKWEGEIKESEEMRPEWFDFKNLPLKEMWENDALWTEKVLTKEKTLRGTFWHNEEGRVIKHELES